MGTTAFPAELDVLPTVGLQAVENEPGLEHDVVHDNLHAIIMAMQAKLGIDGSLDEESIDYRVASVEAGLSTVADALAGKADVAHGHAASEITTGVFDAARIASGEAVAGHVPTVQSDGSLLYAAPSAGGGGGSGGGYSEGGAFPGTPAAGDKFYRTDLDLLCFYDGTRWLTVQQFRMDVTYTAQTATFNTGYHAVRQDHGLYLETFGVTAHVAGNNSGSHYWNLSLQWAPADNTYSTLSTLSTLDLGSNVWFDQSGDLGVVLDSTALILRVAATRLSSAGTLYAGCYLTYRLVVS